ncbi:MAG: DUF5058 family protein [Desulfopila sp.]
MEAVMQLANSPILWLLALACICIVLWQTWLYYRMAREYVRETGVLTPAEVRKALKVGVIGTVGPAFAVFTVAVVLIGLVGGPITLARIGVIGSAAFESLASSAGSAGTVGTSDFTFTMLATASWVMALGGSGWLVTTFFLTRGLDKAQERMKKTNPKMIALVGSITPFMAFFVMGYGLAIEKVAASTPAYGVLAATIVGAIAMYLFNRIAGRGSRYAWLREWSMGFAIIAAMIVGTIID